MHPRPRRWLRSNRLLHHRIGIGFAGERSRTGQATPSQSIAARTRVTTALARPPPRYDACAGWIRTNFSRSEVSALFTTDKCVSRGTVDAAHGRFAVEELRAFTTWNLENSPSFPHDKGFGEAGNKNPSGASAREGFETRTLRNGISPFRLREKARARQPRRNPLGCARSASAG